MDPQVLDRKITDINPEWVDRYLNDKISPPTPSLFVRLFRYLESEVDRISHPCSVDSVDKLLDCVNLLMDSDRLGKKAVVIGCGPKPDTIRELSDAGYRVFGIEPLDDGIRQAREYLKGTAEVLKGKAEKIPLETDSQSLILMENVLEHVDSVPVTLSEAYRVIQPGGLLFVRTTNRLRFSMTGINWEFTTRFYNWFPQAVKESYVFTQLHYRPELAHYSPSPAVHWFSFSDLCKSGRAAGFARFYSPYDLLYLKQRASTNPIRFRFRHWCHKQPWLRAIAISQMFGDIFMYKRQE